ncbi:MAG TPA: hypothetical protein VFX96_01000 [Pyrinomonadaceae bacterium]|nr:hypothetical protein [Pyrinomonadaceae bacterium]
MPTPLFSVYVREVFPRAVLMTLTSMAAEVSEEELTSDFALQLLLEARREQSDAAGEEPSPPHRDVLDELYKEMMPLTLTLPEDDPEARGIVARGEFEGRKLLGANSSEGRVRLQLDRNYTAFGGASRHYIYYVAPHGTESGGEPVEGGESEAEPSQLRISIAGRHPWLFASLRKGMLWESTAYSFTREAEG